MHTHASSTSFHSPESDQYFLSRSTKLRFFTRFGLRETFFFFRAKRNSWSAEREKTLFHQSPDTTAFAWCHTGGGQPALLPIRYLVGLFSSELKTLAPGAYNWGWTLSICFFSAGRSDGCKQGRVTAQAWRRCQANSRRQKWHPMRLAAITKQLVSGRRKGYQVSKRESMKPETTGFQKCTHFSKFRSLGTGITAITFGSKPKGSGTRRCL